MKVQQKVYIIKQAIPVLLQLLPLLSDPAVRPIRDAVAGYARELVNSLPLLEEQAAYMRDLEAGQEHFAYFTLAGVQAVADAIDLSNGMTDPIRPGMGQDALDMTMKANLTDAELAAIKIYTAADYRYINSGLEKDRAGWLKSSIKSTEGARVSDNRILGAALDAGTSGPLSPADMAASEGARHGKMAHEGLKKLKPWTGTTYRGMGLTPEAFKAKFVDTNVWTANSFTSTSQDLAISSGFAKNEAKDGKIGFLMVFTVTNGRDIADLSTFANEGEILLMPGATATIDPNIETRGGIKVVRLSQTPSP